MCTTFCVGSCPLSCCSANHQGYYQRLQARAFLPSGARDNRYAGHWQQTYPRSLPSNHNKYTKSQMKISCPKACARICTSYCPVKCCKKAALARLRFLAKGQRKIAALNKFSIKTGYQTKSKVFQPPPMPLSPLLPSESHSTSGTCPAVCATHCTQACSRECCIPRTHSTNNNNENDDLKNTKTDDIELRGNNTVT